MHNNLMALACTAGLPVRLQSGGKATILHQCPEQGPNPSRFCTRAECLAPRGLTCVGLIPPSNLQKYSPWGMKKVLLEMEDQKNSYEQKAKESLQKVLEEKMGTEQQLQSTQRSLALAEQKCEEWRSQYEALKQDWRTLGSQHRELERQLHELQSKLQGADSRDAQMSQALRLLENEHQELQAKIECLQGDRDLYNSDAQDLQDQLRRSEEEKFTLMTRVQQLQSKFPSKILKLAHRDSW
ncbi:TRAF3-interacting JNK-activating modulator-like [Fukomys damarensis]|uniref:TRAF3-interacting JNK-activating modulator-like n=1 Tax=Fukomys damarensis TaxID=885580 RepID=UPI00053FD126|nr:TRAF3-interacting JNK-activating modulator-like [Fukomys damarensis]